MKEIIDRSKFVFVLFLQNFIDINREQKTSYAIHIEENNFYFKNKYNTNNNNNNNNKYINNN